MGVEPSRRGLILLASKEIGRPPTEVSAILLKLAGGPVIVFRSDIQLTADVCEF
jgi:hypothetical protein